MNLHSVENIAGIQVLPSTVKINGWGQRVVQKHNSEEFVTLAELSRTILKTPESASGAEELHALYRASDQKSNIVMRIFSSVRAFFFAHNLRSNIEKMCSTLYSVLESMSPTRIHPFPQGFTGEETNRDSLSPERVSEYGTADFILEIGKPYIAKDENGEKTVHIIL